MGRYSADFMGQQDQRRLSGRTNVDEISEDESIPGSMTTEVEAALQVGSVLCNALHVAMTVAGPHLKLG